MCCVLFVVAFVSPVVCRLLFVVCCSVIVVCCSLCVVRCLLFVVCCLLFVPCSLQSLVSIILCVCGSLLGFVDRRCLLFVVRRFMLKKCFCLCVCLLFVVC